MDGGVTAQWAAVGLLAIGQVVTYLRANHNQQKENIEEARASAALVAQLTNDISNIKGELGNEVYGLRALHENLTHLNEANTALGVRVDEHERRLQNLNNKG